MTGYLMLDLTILPSHLGNKVYSCHNRYTVFQTRRRYPILHSHQFLKTGTRPQTLCKGDGTRVTNGTHVKTEIKMKTKEC